MDRSPRKDADVVNRFFREYMRDRERGTTRALNDYQALYPGHEELIALEYERLTAGGGSPGQGLAAALGVASGARIGPYRVLRELGRGGQGAVLLAEDTRLGRPVALKVLTGLATLSAEHLDRFHREAALAARLDHPGLCSVYESDSIDGVPYVAMRYVEGETLGAKIKRARAEQETLEVADVLGWIEGAALALDVAHDAGIVHRDVKPTNLMITPGGEAVVLDFGLARELETEGPSLTRTGDVFGTPAYMAPEQLDPALGKPDARTDVWALGVTLYESLTLETPFRGATREALYRAILAGRPEDPSTRAPGLSASLRIVLETALAADPDRRYASTRAFASDLAAVRGGRPIAARPIGTAERVLLWARREPVTASLVAGAAALLLAAAGLAGYLLASQDTIHAGETALREVRREELLSRAMGGQLAVRSEIEMREILAGEPSLDYLRVGLAHHEVLVSNFEGALELLDGAPADASEPAAFDRLRATALRGLGRDDEADEILARLEAPSGPLESFVAATQRVRFAPGESGSAEAKREAIDLYLQAILLSERPQETLYHGLLLAALTEDKELAAVVGDALLRKWPESSMAWFYAGMSRGDPVLSAEAYQRAVELDPEFAQAYTCLAVATSAAGDRERGHELYLRSIELTSAVEMKVHLHMTWAATMNFLEDPKAAIEACDRALALDPEHVLALVRKGDYLQDLDLEEEADEALFRALELDPDNQRARRLLGMEPAR